MDIHIDKKVGIMLIIAVIFGFVIGACCGSMATHHRMSRGYRGTMMMNNQKGDYRMMNRDIRGGIPPVVGIPENQPTQVLQVQGAQVAPITNQ